MVTNTRLPPELERRMTEDRRARGRALAYHVVPSIGQTEQGLVLAPPGQPLDNKQTAYWVPSQSGEEDGYTVTLNPDSCSCMDHQRHPGLRCKHLWAAVFFLEAETAARSSRQLTKLIAYTTVEKFLVDHGAGPRTLEALVELKP